VTGLQDGLFENGNLLQAWTSEGDARLLTGLGEGRPTEGKYMAVISTGLGYTTTSGSLIQQFCLETDAATISFDWNFYSEEFLEWVGSQFQDSISVTLTAADDPDNSITILHETVDSLAPIVTAVPNSFDQGDVYATGWLTTTAEIPEDLRGRKVILEFATTDVGDSIYDTAVLIDQVAISPAGP
jgi:hypothetical protein